MRLYSITHFSALLLLADIMSVQAEKSAVNCYEQYCLKPESGWVCKYSGNGQETEFMVDMFCYEDRTQNEIEPHRMSRVAIPPWYYDDELQNDVGTSSHHCKFENASGHEYCFCNKPLCNTKLKLPENFTVDTGLQYWAGAKRGLEASCYHQYCLKRDFGWVCIHSGNGEKTKLLENEYCSEFRSDGDDEPSYMLRAVSNLHIPYDKEFMDNLEKDGAACKFNKTALDFCLCNEPLCNTKFSLPENFQVDAWLAGSPEGHQEE